MKAKRPTAARGADERRRTPRQPARGALRPSPDAPPRRGRPRATDTAPIARPQIKPVRPKNTSQAKARAKARKAKAPKVVRPPLKQRLLVRLSEIEFNPRRMVARVPFVVLVIGSLGLGLGVTLWLSTDAAERSYQLGNARQTNQALSQQKEALERDVLEAQAAPALAESARKLGMIPSRDTAHLVQDPAGNWIVVGTPKPAEGVPPPPLNTPLPDETPAPAAPPAAARPAPPPVADPREMVVRLPERATTPGQAPAPGAPVPTTVPDSAHAPQGQPLAPGPVEPQQGTPLAAPLPGPPPAAAPLPGPPPAAPLAGPLPGPPPAATAPLPGPPPAAPPQAAAAPEPAPAPVPAEQFSPVTGDTAAPLARVNVPGPPA
ncbi:hypothetical protein DVS77_24545 [Mycolicibacterium moriokaense]|nr:hypothetical protein DVS77_24545 [Mycolicibacterium moriokaense]